VFTAGLVSVLPATAVSIDCEVWPMRKHASESSAILRMNN
jgi:hypothetical protein